MYEGKEVSGSNTTLPADGQTSELLTTMGEEEKDIHLGRLI